MKSSTGNLFVWHIKILLYKLWENLWILRNLYPNATYRRVDLKLRWCYFFKNAYRLANTKGILYGHTPLPTMKRILKTCHIKPGSLFIDLGCGDGKAAFYTRCFFGQNVLAIDKVFEFITKAKSVNSLDKIQFECKNIIDIDLSKADVIYFFSTGFSRMVWRELEKNLQRLPKGAKVITVSEPLSDSIKKEFYLWKQFEVFYYFGEATVYCHIKS